MMHDTPSPVENRQLHRSLGLLQATAMNMSNMIGVGPFLTIPLILATMGGPQAMLGWVLGALLAVCDGMVWAELASAVPSSGGTFEYLRVAYVGTRLGRLLPFLFIWQFILSGPLEIASGTIGFAQYATYLLPLSPRQMQWLAVGIAALAVVLLYRKIESVARFMVGLWVGVILTIAVVLVCGLPHFNASAVFDFPPRAFSFSSGFLLGLGSAMMLAMYDYLGYYSVCYIGDEVRLPSRTMPRSILISVFAVAAIYLLMNISIISVVPWREALRSNYVASEFMKRVHGPVGGALMTVLVCWTAFASVFTLALAYSRIPYAAARDGFFFSAFARLHPRGDFPHVSLLVLGAVAMGASFFSLDAVISVFVTSRILVQFIAQIAAVARLRRSGAHKPGFRMMLYPLPSVIALVGWSFIFATSDIAYTLGAVAMLAAGIVAFAVWSRCGRGSVEGPSVVP
ncbi:MAG: APC family permease [Thermoguttaceae bacterium]